MLEAAFWGAVGGCALVIGALIALRAHMSSRTVGLIMAFGSGVLISAVAYELVAPGFVLAAGSGALAVGLAAGAITFFVGDMLLAGNAPASDQASGSGGMAIALGAVLDGIPESIVIGVSLLGGGGVSVAMVAAVFVSNLPESIAATEGMIESGTSATRIIGMWVALTVLFGIASALGYAVVATLPVAVQAFVQAFAAGALLTMLADSMIPEAFERARRWAGLSMVVGFAVAFAIAAAEAVG